MKRLLMIALIATLLLPVLALGCTEKEPTTSTASIEYSTDDFMTTNHVTKDIEITNPGAITVKLGANPTTGYQWAEDATISGDAVTQKSHVYNAPETSGTVGAPGEDVWELSTQKAGTTTVTFNYRRPWESGDATWSLTLTITVQ